MRRLVKVERCAMIDIRWFRSHSICAFIYSLSQEFCVYQRLFTVMLDCLRKRQCEEAPIARRIETNEINICELKDENREC